MKNLIFVLILICYTTLLFSQVNFELDFSFEKIDPDDERRNIQLFDYNENNTDELFVGYDCENNWKLVCYNLSGEILSTYSQEKLPNETFKRLFLYKDEDVSLMVSASVIEGEEWVTNDSLLIQVIDLENFSMLHSIKYSKDFYWLDVQSITSIEIQKTETNYIIHLGYYYEDGEIVYRLHYSDIIKFQFDENSLTYLETIPKTGLSISYNEIINKFVSYGLYQVHNELSMNSSGYYYLKLIDPITYPLANTILTVYGSCGYDIYFEEMNYSNWPQQFKILTLNDENTCGYGPIFYYKTYTYQSGTGVETTDLFFKSFLPDLSSVDWEENNSQTGTSNILLSTCVSVNNESHYIMYFRGDQLEIRDRINGNIIHHQISSISPFTIKRKSDGELLFFAEQENETGYDVYLLSEPIYVSADDNELPKTNYDLQNHPNPFNPSTTISFSLNTENTESAELIIYNLKGQKVKSLPVVLSDAKHRIEGRGVSNQYSLTWQGTDQNKNPVSSGIYLYQLKVDGEVNQTRKMLLLK